MCHAALQIRVHAHAHAFRSLSSPRSWLLLAALFEHSTAVQVYINYRKVTPVKNRTLVRSRPLGTILCAYNFGGAVHVDQRSHWPSSFLESRSTRDARSQPKPTSFVVRLARLARMQPMHAANLFLFFAFVSRVNLNPTRAIGVARYEREMCVHAETSACGRVRDQCVV